MKQRPLFEPIPELLRPQNCAGEILLKTKWQDNDDDETAEVKPCPDPAAWFSTATGNPYCETHMLTLKNAAHQKEITPP